MNQIIIDDNITHDNIENKNSTNNIEASTLRTREQNYYILLLISYIFFGAFGYFFHKMFNTEEHFTLSIIMLIIIPIILNTYSVLWHVNYEEIKTPKEDLEELEKEQRTEEASKTIPVILFGLGLLLTRVKQTNVIKLIIPYLVFSLFFGTVMTELTNQLIFDHNNLDRLIIAEEITFMFLTLSFGLMFMSIWLTLKNLK